MERASGALDPPQDGARSRRLLRVIPWAAPLALGLASVGACGRSERLEGKAGQDASGAEADRHDRPARPAVNGTAVERSGGPRPSGAARSAPEAQTLEALTRGLRAAQELRARLETRTEDPRASYLKLRRSLASGLPFWRKKAAAALEPVIGPPRSVEETGGALLALDSAMDRRDAAAALRELGQIEAGLSVVRETLSGSPLSAAAIASAISDAAFHLGAVILESSAGIPDGPDAVLADTRGTLDAVEIGIAALGAHAPPDGTERREIDALVADLRRQLDAATTSLDLRDRAALARTTGRLGLFVRRLGAMAGVRPAPPYKPRFVSGAAADDEPVSALTLPAPRARPSPRSRAQALTLERLGELLFFDKRLSRDDTRACASCHVPRRGFADGQARPASLDPKAPRLRHVPSLLYAPLSAAQMWDGRTLTPERQALDVIHSPAEMGLAPEELVAKLGPVYEAAFAALPGGLSPETVAEAIVAFEDATLVPGDSPLDRFARGDDLALSADQRRGLDVFAGKGRCARCHIPPSFGGSRPTDFAVPVFAVLGLPRAPGDRILDPDRGRGAVTGQSADVGAFKTPTVRNVAQSAPFFHSGSFATLEAVVDFYDRGGGRGAGLTVENQDPDVRPLKLTAEQRRVLLAFLRTGLLDATTPRVGTPTARGVAAPTPAPPSPSPRHVDQ